MNDPNRNPEPNPDETATAWDAFDAFEAAADVPVAADNQNPHANHVSRCLEDLGVDRGDYLTVRANLRDAGVLADDPDTVDTEMRRVGIERRVRNHVVSELANRQMSDDEMEAIVEIVEPGDRLRVRTQYGDRVLTVSEAPGVDSDPILVFESAGLVLTGLSAEYDYLRLDHPDHVTVPVERIDRLDGIVIE